MSQSEENLEPTLDDLIKALPLSQRIPCCALKKLLDSRAALQSQQQKQILETKAKYSKLIQPLLQRASQIIRGSSIRPEEVEGGQEFMKKGERMDLLLKGKVIQDYWIAVLSNSGLVDQINQRDEEALKYLIDIQKIDDPKDAQSIQLKFVFKPNPFFKQTEIVRKLDIKNGEALCLQGTVPTWKESKCLTHNLKTVTNKKTGQKKVIQGEKLKSFFTIFINYDKTKPDQLQKAASMISQIGGFLILDSVDYFLGVINADQQSQEDEQGEEDPEAGQDSSENQGNQNSQEDQEDEERQEQ